MNKHNTTAMLLGLMMLATGTQAGSVTFLHHETESYQELLAPNNTTHDIHVLGEYVLHVYTHPQGGIVAGLASMNNTTRTLSAWMPPDPITVVVPDYGPYPARYNDSQVLGALSDVQGSIAAVLAKPAPSFDDAKLLAGQAELQRTMTAYQNAIKSVQVKPPETPTTPYYSVLALQGLLLVAVVVGFMTLRKPTMAKQQQSQGTGVLDLGDEE